MNMSNKKDIIISLVIFVLFLGSAFGLKACQAKYIYGDMRCIWAECWIQK